MTLHHVHALCVKHDLGQREVSRDFLDALESYDWPGNVRELISTLEKTILSEPESPLLFPMQLPPSVRISHLQSSLHRKEAERKPGQVTGAKRDSAQELPEEPEEFPSLKAFRNIAMEKAEARYLGKLLPKVGHDMKRAGEISGLSRARLYALIKKYHVSRPDG